MKRILLLLVITIVCSLNAGALRAQTYFSAFLLTSEEHLSANASSIGYGSFILNKEHTQLSYQIVVWSISDVEAAHFHVGARGVEGNIAKEIPMDSVHRTAVGVWTSTDSHIPLTSALVDSLFAGKIYVNVHTLQNAGGEIRGQLFQPITYAAFASTALEVPPTSNGGNGAAFFLYNPLDTTVFYRGQASNMSSGITDAHVHAALAGLPGPVVKPTPMVKSAGDSMNGRTTGMWTKTDSIGALTSQNITDLSQNALYWNVHTVRYSGGEIRGQITRGLSKPSDTGMWFMAILSGPQEGVQPNPSNGSGTAFIQLSPDRQKLRMAVYYDDLTGIVTDGHIHYGQAGIIPNDGNNIVKPFSHSGELIWTSADPDRPLTSADVDSLFAGHYYVNLHTQNFPDGEIRGQIIPISQPMQIQDAVSKQESASTLMLYPNYPNPFNPSTSIRYTLPEREVVKLEVRNSLGQEISTIFTGVEEAGEHTADFDAGNLPSGVYYVTLSAGTEHRSISVVLNK